MPLFAIGPNGTTALRENTITFPPKCIVLDCDAQPRLLVFYRGTAIGLTCIEHQAPLEDSDLECRGV